jgi:hypothetical protein
MKPEAQRNFTSTLNAPSQCWKKRLAEIQNLFSLTANSRNGTTKSFSTQRRFAGRECRRSSRFIGSSIEKARRVQPNSGAVHLLLARHALQISNNAEEAEVQIQLARQTLP